MTKGSIISLLRAVILWCRAPLGAMVSALPPGYETTMVGNDYYYYYGGAFYINTGNGYQVVQAPYGAVITQIPDGAIQQDINGQTYLVYKQRVLSACITGRNGCV
ncbi:MAG: DUF6515 family protein [Puia sp.]